MKVGTGKHKYAVVPDWGVGKGGKNFGGIITGIGIDRSDHVYLSRRNPPAILVYDRQGTFLSAWETETLANPHGVFADSDSRVWVTDSENHTVQCFTPEGKISQILGTPGKPGEPDQPFNRPTKAVVSPAGELFVSDGYGQYRVHRFSVDGKHQASWGSHGVEPGQFALPHSVGVDSSNRIYVSDRENSRIQVFDRDGAFLSQCSGASWAGLQWPNDVWVDAAGTIYVAEAGQRISIWQMVAQSVRSPIKTPGCNWQLLARWGDMGSEPGQFVDCPHSICVDSHGDIYTAEVPFNPDRVHKFERI